MIAAPPLFTTSIGMSLGITTSGTDTIEYKAWYKNICTNFSHDGSASTFTGKALLSGGIVGYVHPSSFTTVSVGSASNITLTVASASWNAGSTAQFLLTFSSFTAGLPFSGLLTAITRIDGLMTISGTLLSSTTFVGFGSYALTGFIPVSPFTGPVGDGFVEFRTLKNVTCPV